MKTKNFKRVLSIVLALLICTAAMPLSSFVSAQSSKFTKIENAVGTVATFVEDFEDPANVEFEQLMNHELAAGGTYVEDDYKIYDNPPPDYWGNPLPAGVSNTSKKVFSPYSDIDVTALKDYQELTAAGTGINGTFSAFAHYGAFSAPKDVRDSLSENNSVMNSFSAKVYPYGLLTGYNGEGFFIIYAYKNAHNFKVMHFYLGSGEHAISVEHLDFNDGNYWDRAGTFANAHLMPKSEGNSLDKWYDFEVKYTDTQVIVTVTNEVGKSEVVTYANAIPAEERVAAFGNVQSGGNYQRCFVDDVKMVYSNADADAVLFYDEHKSVIDYYNTNATQWTDTAVTKEAAETAFVEAYAELSDASIAALAAKNIDVAKIYAAIGETVIAKSHITTVGNEVGKVSTYFEDFEDPSKVTFDLFADYTPADGSENRVQFPTNDPNNPGTSGVLPNNLKDDNNNSEYFYSPYALVTMGEADANLLEAFKGKTYNGTYSAMSYYGNFAPSATVRNILSQSGNLQKASAKFNSNGHLGWFDGYFIIYDYQDEKNFKALRVLMSGGDNYFNIYQVALNDNNYLDVGYVAEDHVLSKATNPANAWYDFTFEYTTNSVIFTLTGPTGDKFTKVLPDAVSPENRIFAVGDTGPGWPRVRIDDVELVYSDTDMDAINFYDEHKSVIDFYNTNATEWTDTTITKEAAEIAFAQAYAELSDASIAAFAAKNIDVAEIYAAIGETVIAKSHITTKENAVGKVSTFFEDFENTSNVSFGQFMEHELAAGGIYKEVDASAIDNPSKMYNTFNVSDKVFSPLSHLNVATLKDYVEVNGENGEKTPADYAQLFNAFTLYSNFTASKAARAELSKNNSKLQSFSAMIYPAYPFIGYNGEGISIVYAYKNPRNFKSLRIFFGDSNYAFAVVEANFTEENYWTRQLDNFNNIFPKSEGNDINQWYDLNVEYTDSSVIVKLTNEAGKSNVITLNYAIPADERIAAFGNTGTGANEAQGYTRSYVDDVEMVYSNADIDAVLFYDEHKAVIDYYVSGATEWTDTTVSKEDAELAFFDAYAALSDASKEAVKAKVANIEDIYNTISGSVTVNLIDAFKVNHAALITASDKQFTELLGTYNYDSFTAMYNAALSDYNAMPEAVKTLEEGKPIVLAMKKAALLNREFTDYKTYDEALNGKNNYSYKNDFEAGNANGMVQSNHYSYPGEKDVIESNGFVADKAANDVTNKSSKYFAIQSLYNYQKFDPNRLRTEYFSLSNGFWGAARNNSLALKYASGKFAISSTKPYVPMFIVYEFTDINNYKLFDISGYHSSENDYLRVNDVHVVNGVETQVWRYDRDNPRGKYNSAIAIGENAATNSGDDQWIDFEIHYNAIGEAVLTLGIDGKRDYYVSNGIASAANRYVAFGKSSGFNNDANPPIPYSEYTLIDDIHFEFAADSALEAYSVASEYRNTYRDLMLKDVAFVAPYDIAKINAAAAELAELDAFADVFVQLGITDAIVDLKSAAERWTIDSDEDVAASYKAIFAVINEDNVKAAYNVYNRLTVAQRALLEAEYDKILDVYANKAKAASNTIDIAVLGDSNTQGQGVADYAYRWTNRLDEALGSNYTVDNYGIGGFRIVHDVATMTGIQFEKDDRAGAYWQRSHYAPYDVVIVALGTNDAGFVNDSNKEAWKNLYEQVVQSYLAMENAPTVILQTFGRTTSENLVIRDSSFDNVNDAIREIGQKYELAVLDIAAMYEYDPENWLFQGDNLHWGHNGHQWIADGFEEIITDLAENTYVFDDQIVFYGFDANVATGAVNGFAPEIVSATIRNSKSNQDIRFKATIGNNIAEGKEIVEFGMILADYRYIQNGDFDLDDMTVDADTNEKTKDYVVVGKSSSADNTLLGKTFYVNIGGLDDSTYGAPFIARAYVKYADGTVYYSANTKSNGDYNARTGVKDGYAVRSVISITKAMLAVLASVPEAQADVASVVTVVDGVITGYVNEGSDVTNRPLDTSKLFAVVVKHQQYL